MTANYSFEDKTINGMEYVIAEPTGRPGEPIRVRADWVDRDEMGGEWEQLIKQVVQPETIDDVNIADGHGGISRREAVKALAGAEADGETLVSSEAQADVLIEYLADEEIIGIEGDQLVLFRDPRGDERLNGPALMNWAALMSAVIESIDEHLERINDAKERFEETLDTLETEQTDSNEHLSKTAQRLQNLGPGQGVPDPAELDDAERQQYHRLKEHYVFLRNMEKAKEQNLFENINAGTEEMKLGIERLETTREAYEIQHRDVRMAAVQNEVFPEAAMKFVENVGNVITKLTGAEEDVADDIDHTDLDTMIQEDFGETVDEQASNVTDLADTLEEGVGENLQI